ncbi:MAG TPA: substrate-binding domain-containing protein, partial [Burkholderiales bacterium]|nr:substrate-binding domain-containing protein [Burkholderiales bacterium]
MSTAPRCLASHPVKEIPSSYRALMYPLLALLAMALIWLPAGASMAETFKFGGTGSGLGAIRILADAYGKTHPQFSLTIVPSLGSSGGLKALDAGVIHIAVISRSLKAEETAKGMTAVEYGKTPFVLATTKQNVSGLTLAQIAA